MTTPPAGKPDDSRNGPRDRFGMPSVNYADELAGEIDEIASRVTDEIKEEAEASLRSEENSLEKARLEIEVGLLQVELRKEEAKNSDRLATTALRSEYAGKAYKLATRSLWFWGGLIGFEALVQLFAPNAKDRHLSDAVLIAVTTGCTVNVLAAFLGVIRGLFPSKPAMSAKPKKGKKPKQPGSTKPDSE